MWLQELSNRCLRSKTGIKTFHVLTALFLDSWSVLMIHTIIRNLSMYITLCLDISDVLLWVKLTSGIFKVSFTAVE